MPSWEQDVSTGVFYCPLASGLGLSVSVILSGWRRGTATAVVYGDSIRMAL